MKERILGRGLAIALALAFSLTILAAAIYLPATSKRIMHPLMAHFAPPEETRLPAEEYTPVVDMITAYLAGSEDTFQHIFTVGSAEYAAFNQKEQHHMADVQLLFRLCRCILWLGLILTVTLSVIIVRKHSRYAFLWLRRTLLAILAAVTVVIALACIDFDSLFVLFHRIAFTNDLWLLNPATDLLIRLMPIEFFISYAAVIGCCWLLGMAALLVISTILIRNANERE